MKRIVIAADVSGSMYGQGKDCILEQAVKCVRDTISAYAGEGDEAAYYACSSGELREILFPDNIPAIPEPKGRFSFQPLTLLLEQASPKPAYIILLSDGSFDKKEAAAFKEYCGGQGIIPYSFMVGADCQEGNLHKASRAAFNIYDIAAVLEELCVGE
ncbi:MAG: hypothetical protein Pg6C_11090 [Treponemataceae bacterium]|nr:MAG: hypothetical protein Pg6C_11090 [Treponemataceae bacterium]